jgi:aspartyl-tRNA(Asn)/glutamyl-tRNA(Gln) amidotransferase subunit C
VRLCYEEQNMTDALSKRGDITPEIFDHLVGLAALALDKEEKAYLRKELNGQLRAIRALDAIELDEDLPVTTHGVPYPDAARPPIRQDEPRPPDKADSILAQAPEVENRYLVVPDIPQEALE